MAESITAEGKAIRPGETKRAHAARLGIPEETYHYRLRHGIELDAPKMSAAERLRKTHATRREEELLREQVPWRIYPTKPVNPFARMVV